MAEGIKEAGSSGASILALEAKTLTGAFAVGNTSAAYKLAPLKAVEVAVDYTMHASETANTCEVQLLLSDDGVDFYPSTVVVNAAPANGEVVSAGHRQLLSIVGTAGVKESRRFQVPASAKLCKVQAREIGLASNGGICTVRLRFS